MSTDLITISAFFLDFNMSSAFGRSLYSIYLEQIILESNQIYDNIYFESKRYLNIPAILQYPEFCLPIKVKWLLSTVLPSKTIISLVDKTKPVEICLFRTRSIAVSIARSMNLEFKFR